MILEAKEQKVQQVLINHLAITEVILSLHHRAILMVSAYIFYNTNISKNKPRLFSFLNPIQETYVKRKENTPNLGLLVSGDFNRCDILYDENQLASHFKQKKRQDIVEFWGELDLQFLLL